MSTSSTKPTPLFFTFKEAHMKKRLSIIRQIILIHIPNITLTARILPKTIRIRRRGFIRLVEIKRPNMVPAQRGPIHSRCETGARRRIHIPDILENGRFAPEPVLREAAVGGHAADVQAVALLGREGAGRVGPGLQGEDVVVPDAGAGAGDVGGKAAGAGELGEVVGVGVPEVAVGADVVGRVGDVEAALVAGACGHPCGYVVAFLDFEGCELSVVVAGRGCGDYFSLGPLLALVKPDGAAEDSQAFALADVDGLVRLGVRICDGDKECDIAEVEGPAVRDPVHLDVVVGVEIVGAWRDLDVFGGKFGIILFEHPGAEVGAVEVFAIGNGIYGSSGGDSVFSLWGR